MTGERIQVRWESDREQGVAIFVIQPLEAHRFPYGIEVGGSEQCKGTLLPIDPGRIESPSDWDGSYMYKDTLITCWRPMDPNVGSGSGIHEMGNDG